MPEGKHITPGELLGEEQAADEQNTDILKRAGEIYREQQLKKQMEYLDMLDGNKPT